MINFFYSSIGTPRFDDIRVPNKIVDDVYEYDSSHFSESVGTEDLFLVLYLNGEYRKNNLNQGNGEATELLAFDWEETILVVLNWIWQFMI